MLPDEDGSDSGGGHVGGGAVGGVLGRPGGCHAPGRHRGARQGDDAGGEGAAGATAHLGGDWRRFCQDSSTFQVSPLCVL